MKYDVNTLTRKELKLLVALLGGADAVRQMIPNLHISSGWRDAKHPNVTFGQEEAILNMIGESGVKGLLNGKKLIELKDADSSLDLLVTITIPGHLVFPAQYYFNEDVSDNALVKIYSVGLNFKELYLDKEERPAEESTLRCHMLRRDMQTSEIITALGGEHRFVSTLFGLFQLLKIQKDGGNGPLTTSRRNIFRIPDIHEIPRTVQVCWLENKGWDIGAITDAEREKWDRADLVFSPGIVNP